MSTWRDEPMTEAQDNMLAVLQEKIKENYESSRPFYDIVEKLTGKRKTDGLTKGQASDLINAVKEQLL